MDAYFSEHFVDNFDNKTVTLLLSETSVDNIVEVLDLDYQLYVNDVLMALSKTIDCLPHDFIVDKLQTLCLTIGNLIAGKETALLKLYKQGPRL